MNHKRHLISVVVPIYNTEKYLAECLESIILQTYDNLEIILVDDGSTDKSGQICENHKKLDKRIKYFKQKNSGVSSARNRGIREARGAFITFIDSDDTVNKDFINNLYNNLIKHSASIITTAVMDVKVSVPSLLTQKISSGELLLLSKENTLRELYKGTLEGTRNGVQMLRLGMLNDYNIRYDEKMNVGEDFDFFARAVMKSDRVVIDRSKLYFYRSNPSSAMMREFSVTHFDAIKNVEKVGRSFQNKIDGLKELVDIMVFSDCIYYGAKMHKKRKKWPKEYLSVVAQIKKYRLKALISKNAKNNTRIKAFIVYALGVRGGLIVARRLIRW
jgi:glycosyltransferase involved in cell wall biosynthesis